MRQAIALLLLAVVACGIDRRDDSDTGSAVQGLCTVEDQEAGLCEPPGGWVNLQQYTHDQQQAQVPGQTPINESWGYCNDGYCAVRWEFSSFVIVTVCTIVSGNVVSCTTIYCTPGVNCIPSRPA